jgi:methionyl-tRNA formyltransferase
VIDLFNDNLFNYHNTLLPTERGASAYTWKILSQNRLGGLTIHKIEETLDVGNIITQIKFNFPRFCYTQKDYYDFISKRETRFIINFLNSLVSGRKYKQIKQIEKFSTYWPKLDTQLHGYLDWNWSVKEIVLFIRAFDDPHPGAMTFIGGKKVHLKKCVTHKEKIHFHPFQTGLVFRICERRLHVATKDGCLLINNILDDDGNDITSTIKLGHRFHTPISFLDNAKTTRSSYGDEVKKVRT